MSQTPKIRTVGIKLQLADRLTPAAVDKLGMKDATLFFLDFAKEADGLQLKTG